MFGGCEFCLAVVKNSVKGTIRFERPTDPATLPDDFVYCGHRQLRANPTGRDHANGDAAGHRRNDGNDVLRQ